MKDFTMSQYKNKEELYKAKSEYLQSKLVELKRVWEEGWVCAGDDNEVKFNDLMNEI